MLDNALIQLILTTIIAQETIVGIPGLPIAQAFQPTKQGVNTQPTAYLHKLHDHRYGFRGTTDVYDSVNQKMVHTETQQYETTFQMSALATQNPTTPQAYTASDILNLIAYILQSAATVSIFEAQGVGILRVTDVTNPYFDDDHARNEACPSFDFTLTHKQVVQSVVPVLQSTEFDIIEV